MKDRTVTVTSISERPVMGGRWGAVPGRSRLCGRRGAQASSGSVTSTLAVDPLYTGHVQWAL